MLLVALLMLKFKAPSQAIALICHDSRSSMIAEDAVKSYVHCLGAS